MTKQGYQIEFCSPSKTSQLPCPKEKSTADKTSFNGEAPSIQPSSWSLQQITAFFESDFSGKSMSGSEKAEQQADVQVSDMADCQSQYSGSSDHSIEEEGSLSNKAIALLYAAFDQSGGKHTVDFSTANSEKHEQLLATPSESQFVKDTYHAYLLKKFEAWCDWDWADLRQPVFDLLLMLYNRDHESQPTVFFEHLSKAIEILSFWRRHPQAEDTFSAQNLLNFIIEMAIQVIGEIRVKLLYKACYSFKIISFSRNTDTLEGSEEAPEPAEQLGQAIIRDYRDNAESYDSFVESMWRYLDLLDRTAPIIEDLYLRILKGLYLQRPNELTVFKQVHWQAYRNLILKDPTIRLILAEVEQYRHSGHASGDPGQWMDRIRYVRSANAQQSYKTEFNENPRSAFLQEACEEAFSVVHDHQNDLLGALFRFEMLKV